ANTEGMQINCRRFYRFSTDSYDSNSRLIKQISSIELIVFLHNGFRMSGILNLHLGSGCVPCLVFVCVNKIKRLTKLNKKKKQCKRNKTTKKEIKKKSELSIHYNFHTHGQLPASLLSPCKVLH
ncbi:hypothetical protein L9F63_022309, partial [Diploptera punctata]